MSTKNPESVIGADARGRIDQLIEQLESVGKAAHGATATHSQSFDQLIEADVHYDAAIRALQMFHVEGLLVVLEFDEMHKATEEFARARLQRARALAAVRESDRVMRSASHALVAADIEYDDSLSQLRERSARPAESRERFVRAQQLRANEIAALISSRADPRVLSDRSSDHA